MYSREHVVGLFIFTFITLLLLNNVLGFEVQDGSEPWHDTNTVFYDNILQYCFDHTDQILTGSNPVQDLVKAGLVPPAFDGFSCESVQKLKKFKDDTKFLNDFSGLEEALK